MSTEDWVRKTMFFLSTQYSVHITFFEEGVMAELERSSAAAPARTGSAQTEIEALPALFGRLSDGVMTLLDTKLSLLKVEIKEDVDGYVGGAVKILIGGIVAAVGFALVNVAVALFI